MISADIEANSTFHTAVVGDNDDSEGMLDVDGINAWLDLLMKVGCKEMMIFSTSSERI